MLNSPKIFLVEFLILFENLKILFENFSIKKFSISVFPLCDKEGLINKKLVSISENTLYTK